MSAFYSIVWVYYAMSYQSDIDEQVVILVNYMIINRLVQTYLCECFLKMEMLSKSIHILDVFKC